MERTDLVQALARVLIAHLVAERGRLHEMCEQHSWLWSRHLSAQLDIIDHGLTALGLFDFSHGGDGFESVSVIRER
jgi:hypothetical protein